MNRGMFDHPIFAGRPERVGVWAWMIATAAWKDTRQDASGQTVLVKRGQLLTYYRQISNGTGAGVQVCRTLIDKLRGEHAVNTELTHGRLLITIRNYEKYQAPAGTANTAANTGLTQEQHTKEQSNKDITLEAIASNAPDTIEISLVSRALWDVGPRFLISRGVREGQAKSVIGKWRQGSQDAAILAAIEAAQKSGTQDPIPYITEALKEKADAKPASKSAERLNAFIAGARGAP